MGSGKLEVGSWKLEVGSGKLEGLRTIGEAINPAGGRMAGAEEPNQLSANLQAVIQRSELVLFFWEGCKSS